MLDQIEMEMWNYLWRLINCEKAITTIGARDIYL